MTGGSELFEQLGPITLSLRRDVPYSCLGQKSSADDARKRHAHHFKSDQISWCSRNYWRLVTNRWILEEAVHILIVLAGSP